MSGAFNFDGDGYLPPPGCVYSCFAFVAIAASALTVVVMLLFGALK